MSDTEDMVDEFLEHFGVKGMQWGKRKGTDDSSGTSSSKSAVPQKPKKLNRKEVRAEKKAYYDKKAEDLFETAYKDPESLIRILTPGTVPTIITGKEFVDHMARGGYMNARMTDVFATQDKELGGYLMNEKMNERYVRSDKKK